MRRALVAVVVGTAVLAGCASPAASPPPSAPATAEATQSPPANPTPSPSEDARLLAGQPMRHCRVNSQAAWCGKLTVSEDSDNTAGRTIDLQVAVIPSRSPNPQPDPVFMLAGGPGGAATESSAWAASTFSSVNRDFVLVDQRGTGSSNRLVIPEAPDFAGLEGDELEAAVGTWLAGVFAELPGDPRYYTTSIAMDDLDAVREALGYEQINLYGGSYGATAAQYYLRQHEEHVRSVVLDGGTLLDVPVFERIAMNTQRALDLLFTRCDADTSCHTAFPNLRDEFQTIVERLEVESVTTSVVDPATGERAVIDALTFASAIHSALLSVDSSSRLPGLLHLAYREDWEAVARAAASTTPPAEDDLAMSLVIRCSEAWARYEPDEVARLGIGTFELEAQLQNARGQAATCRSVPVGVVPDNDGDPVRSNVPVLLVLGQADPQDPPSNVADAGVELPNSLTVVVPGQGHTVGHLGCMPSIITAFIRAGTTRDLDVSCAATGVPMPPFWISN